MHPYQRLASKLAAFRNDCSGNAGIDTAFSMVLFLTAMFGVMDCSRLAYIDHFLASASTSASRYAMVRGASWNGAACSGSSSQCTATSSDVTNYVNSLDVTGVSTNLLNVNTSWPGTAPAGGACDNDFGNNGPGCQVNVQVSYTFNFVLPFLPSTTYTLHSAAAQTIVE